MWETVKSDGIDGGAFSFGFGDDDDNDDNDNDGDTMDS